MDTINKFQSEWEMILRVLCVVYFDGVFNHDFACVSNLIQFWFEHAFLMNYECLE